LAKSGLIKRYEKLINEWGDTGVFEKGLYGSSEMFVDAFMQMYKSKILKRKVFESIPLMKLINEGRLAPDSIPMDIIDQLIEMKGYYAGNIDGIFGPITRSSVVHFQGCMGLVQDGIVGIKTWTALGVNCF